jgi:excisionase family DNA binding protein
MGPKININAIYLTDQQWEFLQELFLLLKENQSGVILPNKCANAADEYLTAKEAAKLLRISIRTLWVHIHERESFPFTKSGRKYMIKRSDLIAFMDSRSYHPAEKGGRMPEK